MMRALLAISLLVALGGSARADVDEAALDDDEAGAESSDPVGTSAGAADAHPDDVAIDVLAPLAGPAVGEVLEAAYQAAGLDRSPVASWSRRARLAGLVPWLSVRFGRDASWTDLEPEIDHDTTVEVRATWRLDRLVFDSRELQVSTIDTARRRERRRLASRVIRTYFAWRRLAAASVRRPGLAIRAEEAAAELDAVTDGWFGEALTKRRAKR